MSSTWSRTLNVATLCVVADFGERKVLCLQRSLGTTLRGRCGRMGWGTCLGTRAGQYTSRDGAASCATARGKPMNRNLKGCSRTESQPFYSITMRCITCMQASVSACIITAMLGRRHESRVVSARHGVVVQYLNITFFGRQWTPFWQGKVLADRRYSKRSRREEVPVTCEGSVSQNRKESK